MRRVAVVALAAAGCIALGPSGTWVPIADVTGALAPATGTASVAQQAQGSSAPTTLRVVTYNIRDGGVDPATIAAALMANSNLATADVVLLQEAEAFPVEGTPRVERLAAALGMSWIYAPARPELAGTLGDAILSRYPLDNFAVMALPLASLKRQRIAVAADLHVGARTLRVVTTQLDTSLNITNRVRQLHPVVIDLPAVAIVGGDFNTNPYAWQDGVVPLVGTAAIADTDQAPLLDDYMAQQGFANPTAALGITEIKYGIESRLDAVYARGVTVLGGGVERSIGLSDHFPVWIAIAI